MVNFGVLLFLFAPSSIFEGLVVPNLAHIRPSFYHKAQVKLC